MNEDFYGMSESNNSRVDGSKGKTFKRLLLIIVVIVVGIVVIDVALSPSRFEEVKSECVHIAGAVSFGEGYFRIETKPEGLLLYNEQDALDAIKYANEEFGFYGIYSQMLETSAIMGRQTEENDEYKVSWTYHPDDGLKVTYSKK